MTPASSPIALSEVEMCAYALSFSSPLLLLLAAGQ